MRNQIIRTHTVEEFITIQSEAMITGNQADELKNSSKIGDKLAVVLMNSIYIYI